jgi:ribonuclease HI
VSYDVTLYFDGACTFNCGPEHVNWPDTLGAWAFVAYGKGGGVLKEAFGTLTPCSSNMAELLGALEALRWAITWGARHVRLRGDSQFVIHFLLGRNRISQLPHIAQLQRQIAGLISHAVVSLHDGRRSLRLLEDGQGLILTPEHVPRSKNRRADLLAGRCIGSRVYKPVSGQTGCT